MEGGLKNLVGKSYAEVDGCCGLARRVNELAGKWLPPFPDICARYAAEEIRKRRQYFTRIHDDYRPGDLVHVRARPDGRPHVATYIGHNEILNVSRRWGVHRLRLTHPQIRNRIEGVYRYAAA